MIKDHFKNHKNFVYFAENKFSDVKIDPNYKLFRSVGAKIIPDNSSSDKGN